MAIQHRINGHWVQFLTVAELPHLSLCPVCERLFDHRAWTGWARLAAGPGIGTLRYDAVAVCSARCQQ